MKKYLVFAIVSCISIQMYAQNPAHKKMNGTKIGNSHKTVTVHKASTSKHKTPETAHIRGEMIIKNPGTYLITSNNEESKIVKSKLLGDYTASPGTYVMIN
jgi:hypothetical protein